MRGERHPPLGQSSRDPALDGLRGLAILLVFLSHYGGGLHAHSPAVQFFGYLTQAGWTGVELFFVLSGFLITRILLRDTQAGTPLQTFFLRRAFRILPLYLFALALCAVVTLLAGAPQDSLKSLVPYLLFLQNLPPSHTFAPQTSLPLYHLWSLAVEEQFYLLWPLVLRFTCTPRRTLQVCLALFLLSAFSRTLLASLPSTAALTGELAALLPARAGALALGGALACLPDPSGAVPAYRRILGLAVVLGITVFLLTGLHTGGLLPGSPGVFTLGLATVDLAAAGLLALALLPGRIRRVLSLSWLTWLGRLSYSLYVLHILLQPVFDHLAFRLTHTTSGFRYQGERLLVALPLTLLASWATYSLIERPFLRLARRFARQENIGPLPRGV